MSTENVFTRISYTEDPFDVIQAEIEHLKLDPAFTGDKVSGLAVSGGGIRSASFGLGVMQALVANKQLGRIDYMSTVSGGGYLGSALTWALYQDETAGTEPENFPLGNRKAAYSAKGEINTNSTKKDNQLLDFIRLHGSYLTPTKDLDIVSFIAVIFRSMLLSLFVYISLLTVLLTCALFGLYHFKPLLRLEDLIKDWLDINTGNQGVLLWVGMIIIIIMLVMAFRYSLNTFLRGPNKSEKKYRFFITGQKRLGWLSKIALTCFLFGSLPYMVQFLDFIFDGNVIAHYLTAGGSTIFGAGVGMWQYKKASNQEENKSGYADILIYAGVIALIYGILLFAYVLSTKFFLKLPLYEFIQPVWFFILLGSSLIFGLLVNLNFIGPHYMWRNRLIEAFMPNKEAVKTNNWQAATEAEGALMQNMCMKTKRPYHIINTNVILANSPQIKYSGRGGDNFLISPLYNGSGATGWRLTEEFKKNKFHRGMTIGTAMASSAAALNPNAGVSGEGVTRNVSVSILLSLLNLRLGYWTSNPQPDKKNKVGIPNFINPGLKTEIFRSGFTEDESNLLLSDGGHYENLAMYELIRRKLSLIIVSDGGADPLFNFDDLANAIEKARVDFGAKIYWKEGYMPDDILPGTSGISSFQKKYKISKHGFAFGKIIYNDKTEGILVYIKLAMIEGLPTDVYSYKGSHPDFPHQSTSDQFFDEKQFEAYRELGYYVAWQMMESELGKEYFPMASPEVKFPPTRLSVRVNGKKEIIREVNFPVVIGEVGAQVSQVLCNLYDQYILGGSKQEDQFPDTGTVEAEVNHNVYEFTYAQKVYPDRLQQTHYYVTLVNKEEETWRSTTNVDARG